MTWHEAKDACEHLDRHLMEVKTEKQRQLAVKFVQHSGSEWMWLGGSDEKEEGKWVWASDNSDIDLVEFWKIGESTVDVDSNNDFLVIHANSEGVGDFYDVGPTNKYPFVCTRN